MIASAQHGQRIQTACLLILAAVAITAVLYFFQPVVVPFVLAVFFTYCLTPVVDAQMRWLRLPRAVAILTTIVLGFLALFLLGALIAAAVSQLAERADEYQAQIGQLLRAAAASLPLERFGVSTEDLRESLLAIPGEAAASFLAAIVSGMMSILTNGMLVLVFVVFMLMGRKASGARANSTLGEIESRTKRYIVAMVLISGILGVLVGATLALLGVRFSLMFGFLAFLLNFIPNIGPVVATILPVPVVLLSPELSGAAKVLAIAIPGAIQFVIGNYFQPKIMGRSLDLHPVAILMSLIFFGLIWGIIGMFLAAPITAVLKILLEKLDHTRPIAHLLAGRLDAMHAETDKPD